MEGTRHVHRYLQRPSDLLCFNSDCRRAAIIALCTLDDTMAELFSLVSAAAGLLDVTVRLVKYARELKKGAATIQTELDSLIEQACMLERVCNTINYTYNTTISRSLEKDQDYSRHDQASNVTRTMWEDLARMISHCRVVVQKIYTILEDICRPPQQSLSKHVDTLVRVRRKRSKEDDLRQCQRELSMYYGSIQLILTIINRYGTFGAPQLFADYCIWADIELRVSVRRLKSPRIVPRNHLRISTPS
jgi:hypothetical protein